MPSRLSRRKLADYAAKQIADGNSAVVDEMAALLVSEKRGREADLLARDIEDSLADMGQLVVRVESARQIDATTRKEIEQLFDGKTVHIEEVIRPELLGGVRISTPSQRLDGTVLKKLNDLRSMN